MTTLYYLRFSTAKQADGQSIHRQTTLLDSYRLQYGLEAPSHIYSDLGVSAFTGSNLEGQLGELLQDLKDGVYKAPVTVLVESVDRLSRGEIQDASALVQLIQTHSTLITVMDGHRYEQGKFDLVGMITQLVKSATAREESEKKSNRAKSVYAKARAEGKRQNTQCKRWLKVAPDKASLSVIPEEAAFIRELFKLKRDGYGLRRLLAKSDTLKGSLKPYSYSALARLFHDEELVTYGVITETDFILAKGELKIIKGGRPTASNLFKGILCCGQCGKNLVYKAASGTRIYPYLHCTTRNLRGVTHCDFPLMNYSFLEPLLLDSLSLLARELFTHKVIDVEALKASKEELEASLIVLNNRIQNVIAALSDMPEELATALAPIKTAITDNKLKLERVTGEYQDAVANLEDVSLVTPTTEAERISFNLRLSKTLSKLVVKLSEDGSHFLIKGKNSNVTLMLDRALTRWELDDRATSADNDVGEPSLEFGPDFE